METNAPNTQMKNVQGNIKKKKNTNSTLTKHNVLRKNLELNVILIHQSHLCTADSKPHRLDRHRRRALRKRRCIGWRAD